MYLEVTLKLKSSMIVDTIGIDDVNVGDTGDIKIGNVGTMIVGIIGSNDVKVADVAEVKIGDVDVKIDDVITDVKVDDVIADVIDDVIKSAPPCVSNGKIKLLSSSDFRKLGLSQKLRDSSYFHRFFEK